MSWSRHLQAICYYSSTKAREQTNMSDLVEEAKASQNVICKAVPKLNALGLINDKVTSYPLKRIFSLTEKGRRVAEKLAEIEGILGENQNGDRKKGEAYESVTRGRADVLKRELNDSR